MEQPALIPHLFRTEYSKITAVLCKRFGIAHIEVAEDIASDTFLQASETWAIRGLPENPVAWLYAVAKNKATNYGKRDQLFNQKIVPRLTYESGSNATPDFDLDLSPENITDSQLQMIFAVCHPCISAEAQVGLALRVLCGFGVQEIADAFLTSKETINKRLFRAKEKLRAENVCIEFPGPAEVQARLDAVLTTLYLLYNEGYYSAHQDCSIRQELCLEAMRLTHLLMESPATNQPAVNALFALMSFQSSRFAARTNAQGEAVLYGQQDELLWDKALIAQGTYFLEQASQGQRLSRYHLEAAIAYWHTIKADTPDKWKHILQLYNELLLLEYSPIAALNRTYALSKAHSKKVAIAEAEKLALAGHLGYHSLLGELYSGVDNKQAATHFRLALSLAGSAADQVVLTKKLKECEGD